MLELKQKIKEASTYRGFDFSKANGIGVICRGPSVSRLDLCCNKFDYCYLSGEFNNSLPKIKKYITGKNIVLSTMQNDRYRTTRENCAEYNIQNIQIPDQNGSLKHRDCVKRFDDLKVVGITKEYYRILEKINGNDSRMISTTGLFAILSALYYNPSSIYIIGMDFYYRDVKPYYVREAHDVSIKDVISISAAAFRRIMIDFLSNVCKSFKNINIYLYTMYDGIKSHDNLHVIYV